MICEVCGDNRFEIIEKAKTALIESTNIETSEDEMKVIDSFLFRCWQMGWLDKYDDGQWKACEDYRPSDDLVEVVRCKDCIHYEKHETWSACTYWSGNPYEQASVIDEDFCSYGERRET